MTVNTATEQAYKNGYEHGYEAGKRDAVKHGRWEKEIDDDEFFGEVEYPKCSECGIWRLIKTAYCPNCGTKMDLKGE